MSERCQQQMVRSIRAAGTLLLLCGLLGISIFGCASPPDLTVPAQADAIISGVTVINPMADRFENQSIVIADGVIRAIRPRLASDPDPICPGCYAIPGLIDAHVHTPPRIAAGTQQLFSLLYLAYGVTTVRDVGASEGSVADLVDRLNRGDLVGPRMLRCGPVLDGDPPGWPLARVISNAQEGREVVAELSAAGVDCIKVYNEMGIEAFEAIAAAAAREGLPLVGHVPHGVGMERVFDFEAQHMTGVPYLSRPRPPTGWDLRNEDVIALSDEEVDDALEVARLHRISFTPTLANFKLRLIASDPERFPPTEGSSVLPAYWAKAWDLIAGHPSTEEAIALQIEARPIMRSIVRRAHERGIDILAGTDTIMPWVVPGEALHLEMAELAKVLGGAEGALAAATTTNGQHLGRGVLGMIAPGAAADILLLPGDPTVELGVLRDWRIVFADGRRYDRSVLDQWVEDYRRYFHGWFQRGIMGPVAGIAASLFSHND